MDKSIINKSIINEDDYIEALMKNATWILKDGSTVKKLRPLPLLKAHKEAKHWNLAPLGPGFNPGPDGLFIDTDNTVLVVLEAKMDGDGNGKKDTPGNITLKRRDAFGQGWGYSIQARRLLQSNKPTLHTSGIPESALKFIECLDISDEQIKNLEVIPALLSLQTFDEPVLRLEEIAKEAAQGLLSVSKSLMERKWLSILPFEEHPSTGFRWAAGHVTRHTQRDIVFNLYK